MSKNNDGGPAFPCDSMKQFPAQEGMSLRDYFAGQALAGLLACMETVGSKKHFATEAYSYADAMLAERQKEREHE